MLLLSDLSATDTCCHKLTSDVWYDIMIDMQVHAYVISHLKKDMPSMFGKDSRKKDLINNLGNIFAEIQREHQISPGDFPDLARMQEQLQHQV